MFRALAIEPLQLFHYAEPVDSFQLNGHFYTEIKLVCSRCFRFSISMDDIVPALMDVRACAMRIVQWTTANPIFMTYEKERPNSESWHLEQSSAQKLAVIFEYYRNLSACKNRSVGLIWSLESIKVSGTCILFPLLSNLSTWVVRGLEI